MPLNKDCAVNMLKMCLNWKVMVGLAAAGLGIYLLAPGAFAAALPLLFLAVCPLSMVVMMMMMNRSGGDTGSPQESNDDPVASPATAPPPTASTTEGALQAELDHVQARQTALLDQLEARRRDERQQSGRV